MGIPLKQGRFFTDQDNEKSQPVAVIDEAFAHKYFPNADPLGKRINLGDDRGGLQIIGVVGHVKQWSLNADDKESLQVQLYEPLRQLSGSPSRVGVVVRGEGSGTALMDAIRAEVRSQNSQNIISGVQTLNEVIADSLARQRFLMILLNAFAGVALMLASIGLYGVISYLVGQRTHELGIRMALGAGRRDVLGLILSHGLKMAAAGVALGILAAFGLTQLLAEMLYEVSATDPLIFAGIALLLLFVALLACFVPAWRATRIDPLVALRYE
jgi:predicted permease